MPDIYGTDNFLSSGGLYGSLAGGAIPSTNNYAIASASSPNGVSVPSWSLDSTIKSLSGLATTGANIYATVSNASKKPASTTVNLIDPNTGKPVVGYAAGYPQPQGSNPIVWIIGIGVLVLVALVALPKMFSKDK